MGNALKNFLFKHYKSLKMWEGITLFLAAISFSLALAFLVCGIYFKDYKIFWSVASFAAIAVSSMAMHFAIKSWLSLLVGNCYAIDKEYELRIKIFDPSQTKTVGEFKDFCDMLTPNQNEASLFFEYMIDKYSREKKVYADNSVMLKAICELLEGKSPELIDID